MRRFVGPQIATERDSWYLTIMLRLTNTIGTGAPIRHFRLQSSNRTNGYANCVPPMSPMAFEGAASG